MTSPVIYVSSKQLPHNPEHSYIACRLQPEGNFDTPLFAASGEVEDDTRQIAVDICDAVLQWIVKHDFGLPGDKFSVAEVIAVLDCLYEEDDQPGDPKAAEEALRRLIDQNTLTIDTR